jgi:hypothetical protein
VQRQYTIEEIAPADSLTAPLVQLADLVAGISAYSHESYATYERWLRDEQEKVQLTLFTAPPDAGPTLSRGDRERCPVLRALDTHCKTRKLGVSLATNRGLTTYPPGAGVHFWLYTPQRPDDRAPVKPDPLTFAEEPKRAR